MLRTSYSLSEEGGEGKVTLSTTMEVNRGKNQFVQTQNSKEAWKVKILFFPFIEKAASLL